MYRRFLPLAMLAVVLSFAPAASHVLAADPAISSAPIGTTPNEYRIRQALSDDKTTLEFTEVPLKDVVDFIKDRHHLEITFDVPGLKDAAIDPTAVSVSVNVHNIGLRSALNLILSQFNLVPVIKDEVLVITTKDKATSTYDTRLYDVRDLLVREGDPGATVDFDSLIDTILTTVNPSSWDKSGGQGSVTGFSSNGICALVVWQNYEGQEQVETVLAKLRSLKPQRAVRQ